MSKKVNYREILPKPILKLNVIKFDDGSITTFTNQDLYFDTLRKRKDITDYYSMHYYDTFAGQNEVISVRRKGSNTYFTINSKNTYLVYQPLQSTHKKIAIWIEEEGNYYLDEYYEILKKNNIIVNSYQDSDSLVKKIKNKFKSKKR